MADVKDGDIVFEYPDDDDDEIPGTKLPEEKEKTEVKVETKADDIDLEIEDDTPPADKNKEPLPKNLVEDLENDNLEEYSDRVKTRMAQLRKVYHDERREKESADRERHEAIKYAQQISEENKKLKSSLSNGEETYIETLKNALESELSLAKESYRKAYDSGETDSIIDAQQKMNDAQFRLSQAKQYEPRFKNALQEPENPVYIQQNEQRSFKPDAKASAWQEKNDWFGKDEEMTSLALGVHEKLVRSGISPTSDEYYRRIDSTMQKRFPENFGDATLDEDQPAERTKPSNVVAPATRSTAPKKVRLTKTQVALAKKFGITPEQYARETLKLENANG
ncbi:conserved hypothetical protein [Gammaproteobacteria bacterium]